MAKILKNTTGSPIGLSPLGLPDIPVSGQTEIQNFDYTLLASEDSHNLLDPLITSGDIVVNDGVADLTADEGKEFIRYPDESDRIRVTLPSKDSSGDLGANDQSTDKQVTVTDYLDAASAASKVSSADTKFRYLEDKILSGPGVTVVKGTDGVTGEETLSFNATGNFEGKGFQTTFAGNGTFRDSWMSQEDTNVESNESPDIFKYNARLVGIDFTNQNQNADATIVIAIKEYPFSNVNNPDRFYKWTLSNVRSAVRTNATAGFTISAGDVMAIYLKDDGGNSNDVILTMDFIILSAPTTELQFSYSQSFSSNDFPAFNTIPEVLI